MTCYDDHARLKKALVGGGNMVNFGRSLQVTDPALYQWVIDSSAFLPLEAKFTERVYCIENGLQTRPKCPFSGKELRFANYFIGYKTTSATASTKAVRVAPSDAVPLSPDDLSFLRSNYKPVSSRGFARLYPDVFLRVMSATAAPSP